jgi:hypothetical protein
MTDLKDLQRGDRVRVTRTGERGSRSVWEGELLHVDPEVGFSLRGRRVGEETVERSFFAEPVSLRKWARCEQTVELLERPGRAPACEEHGSEARYVTLVDRQHQSESDPYGDVEGPMPVERLAAMRMLLGEYGRDGEPGRYGLAFLHADRCRTVR